MQWFRLYNRMIDDKKIKLLAFEDRWHFVALCCLKSSGELDEPDRDLRVRQVAVSLGVQLAELDEIARRLRAVKLIDENLQPLNWDKLQFKGETSTKRVREFRKRKKAEQKQPCNMVKRDETVSVTPPDTETDTEVSPNGDLSANADPADFSFEDFEESWAEVAKECGLPTMRAGARDRRRRMFNTRKRQYPDIDDWREAFATLRKAKWMHGDTERGWRCDADDFLDPKKFNRLVEGKYGQAN